VQIFIAEIKNVPLAWHHVILKITHQRSSLFWDVKHRRLVVIRRRCGTTYLQASSSLRGSSGIAWTLKHR